MENVTLTQKEQTRLQILNSLLAEHMTLDQAATLMGVRERRTRRILAAYREEGAAAVAHQEEWYAARNTGKAPTINDLRTTTFAGSPDSAWSAWRWPKAIMAVTSTDELRSDPNPVN